MTPLGWVKNHSRKDPVLFVSLILAAVSFLIVPPSLKYLDYIDVRTLAILLCLMMVVAGITETRAFDVLARKLLMGDKGIKTVSAILVGLPFFLSMFITNDVSLITFVPFAIVVLGMADRKDLIVPVIVFQTVAANLGSMLLPFGNPQNIFIASKYEVGMMDFITTVGPFVAIGAVVLVLMAYTVRGGRVGVEFEGGIGEIDNRRLSVYLLLFAVSVCAVIRVIPYQYVLAIVLVGILFTSPKILIKVDWGLLLTFVFLFVFTGNMASVDFVNRFIVDIVSWNTVVSSALVSQFISNVPATVMLSNFTSDWSGLLSGVNIGGFGTPIASMASIITLRIYSKEKDSDRIGFLKVFTVANVVMLCVLLVSACLIR